MSAAQGLLLALATLYAAFLWWYGGRGRPLSAEEIESCLQRLGARAKGPQAEALLDDVRQLVSHDDGREFVMQNLVRHRAEALYPPGYEHYGTSAKAADQRYGRALLPHLLRYGNLLVFVARRSGQFITEPGVAPWDYVAMVRYRSRRDFLRFALAIEQQDITMHKWAAIASTQVFPVRPMISLLAVRLLVGALLAVAALPLYLWLS
ncbi:MAG TPA: hypothetical protein VGE47_11885 [Burkholderiaceae bacterium]